MLGAPSLPHVQLPEQHLSSSSQSVPQAWAPLPWHRAHFFPDVNCEQRWLMHWWFAPQVARAANLSSQLVNSGKPEKSQNSLIVSVVQTELKFYGWQLASVHKSMQNFTICKCGCDASFAWSRSCIRQPTPSFMLLSIPEGNDGFTTHVNTYSKLFCWF